MDADYQLNQLQQNDRDALGRFFTGLSSATRSRFGPHPLNTEHAAKLCYALDEDPAGRFVLYSDDAICGYFIVDPVLPGHEVERYMNYGIALESGKDCMFAPCMADRFQGRGLGNAVMPFLLKHCRDKRYRSMVLLGGTQESNERALKFYQRWGFRPLGTFMTSVSNIDMQLMLDG